MARSALGLLVALLLCVSSEAQQAMVWEKDALEFKPAPGTKEIDGAFRFTNRAKEPLVLARVTANCGCLKIVNFPRETAAGASGTIEFRYDAAGKEGVQTARIEVQPEGENPSPQTLRIRLELSLRVVVRPGVVIWEKSTAPREVSISVMDPGLVLEQTVKFAGDFRGSLIPGEAKGAFRLRLEPPVKPGPAEGWATLTFRDGANEVFERKIRLIANEAL